MRIIWWNHPPVKAMRTAGQDDARLLGARYRTNRQTKAHPALSVRTGAVAVLSSDSPADGPHIAG
jgi:hypothetical protein